MSIAFIYPSFLWFLLFLPLIVLLTVVGKKAKNTFRFWGGLALRCGIFLLLVLALAGLQLRVPSDRLNVIFLLDVSDSVTPGQQVSGEKLIREALDEMGPKDQAAVIVFGKNALVERSVSSDQRLLDITSIPVTTRTDIGSALQLATALFPNEGARRIVLISDGKENMGSAIDQAELAAMQDIELLYMPLEGERDDIAEVRVSGVEVPSNIRQGEDFNLDISLESTVSEIAALHVFEDDRLIYSKELTLFNGINKQQIAIHEAEAGFHRYRVRILPEEDHFLQNNEYSAFTIVHGEPVVLIVEGEKGEADMLVQGLGQEDYVLDRVSPEQFPSSLLELAHYDAVVLVNVAAANLPFSAMENLPAFVNDLGKGLLMIGGGESYGAGGYLRTPIEEILPVDMDVKSRERAANLALVLAVDKSGSMGRCHCDNPDLDQVYTRSEVGQPKVDIAKSAIMRSAGAISEEDYLGVVVFDEEASWAWELAMLPDAWELEQSVGSVQAAGQTNLSSGIEAAYDALAEVDAKRKHIILMTDGWVNETDIFSRVGNEKDSGVTLSIVAAGGGSAEYLHSLSVVGGGEYYPAENVLDVPDIFLKETVKSVGYYIVEEPFYPLPAAYTPIFEGVDREALPILYGYNGTSVKQTARLHLLTHQGDPLLATWQHGLGRTAAWTSDFKGQWAAEWADWEQFGRFVSQLVSYVLPLPSVEGLLAEVNIVDDNLVVTLNAESQDGRAMNNLTAKARVINPGTDSEELDMEQIGSGEYQAVMEIEETGVYLIQLDVQDHEVPVGQLVLGAAVPYSAEYIDSDMGYRVFDELADMMSGGEMLEPVQAFLHSMQKSVSAREVWHPLLLLAVVLFPLDVAVRRLVISKRDMAQFRMWLMGIFKRQPGGMQKQEEPLLGSLFEARQRARDKRERQITTTREASQAPKISSRAFAENKREEKLLDREADAPAEDNSLARLRAAKERAKKRR